VVWSYQVGDSWGFAQRFPGNKDHDGTDEENTTEALEEVAEDLLTPMRLWWRRRVAAVLVQLSLGLFAGEAGRGRGLKALLYFSGGEGVPLEIIEVYIPESVFQG
jgi:hypothetical protein